MLSLTIPMRTRNPLNGSQGRTRDGLHARARERREQRSTTLVHLMASRVRRPDVPFRLVVTLTRIAPSSGLDGDGLQASLKSVRDGVADWLAVHDNVPGLTWEYKQERGSYAVRVEVEKR